MMTPARKFSNTSLKANPIATDVSPSPAMNCAGVTLGITIMMATATPTIQAAIPMRLVARVISADRTRAPCMIRRTTARTIRATNRVMTSTIRAMIICGMLAKKPATMDSTESSKI